MTIMSGKLQFLRRERREKELSILQNCRELDQREQEISSVSVTLSNHLSVDDLHHVVLRASQLPPNSLLTLTLNGRVLRNSGELSLQELQTDNCVLQVHPRGMPGGMLLGHHERLRELRSEVEMLEAILNEPACRNLDCFQYSDQTVVRSERSGAGAANSAGTPFTNDDSTLNFTEDDDDQEVILGLFRDIDIDASDSISVSELLAAIRRFSLAGNAEICTVLEDLIDKHENIEGNAQISLKEFSEVFCKLPRVKGERVKWAAALGMEGQLARLLVKGDPFDGLKGLRALEGDALELHIQEVCRRFSEALPSILRKGVSKLKRTGQVQTSLQEHINSKFVLDGAYVGRFATLDDFYRGPEALIGVPNPRIREGAEKEHCLRPNAQRKFTTSNYNITTWPQLEWEFVVCPVDDAPEYRRYPHTPNDRNQWMHGNEWRGGHGRDIITLQALMEDPAVKLQVTKAGLLLEEMICLRLYTGQFQTGISCIHFQEDVRMVNINP